VNQSDEGNFATILGEPHPLSMNSPPAMTRNTIAAMSMPPLRVVAFHEAGHAVVGEVAGVECTSLTIDPDKEEGSFGHITHPDISGIFYEQMEVQMYRHGDDEWPAIRDWVDANTKSSLGGPLAEQRITGAFNWDGAAADIENISQKLLNVYGYEGPDYDEALCPVMLRDPQMGVEEEDWSQIIHRVRELWDDEVEAILTEHWDWVELVAELALKQGTLTGDQIRAARPSEDFDTDFFY